MEAAAKAPKFFEKKQFGLDTVRKELTETGRQHAQNQYSQKFEALQKEHKKEFEAYLCKQFNLDARHAERQSPVQLDGEERTPSKVLQALRQSHAAAQRNRKNFSECLDERGAQRRASQSAVLSRDTPGPRDLNKCERYLSMI